MSQGRKRGYAGILATQRLSKLHKDPAAEANNVIIGRTWLDADQARAGNALGLSKADGLKLRDLKQGEFYAFGPAFNRSGIVRFARIGSAPLIRALESAICLPRPRRPRRFAGYSVNSPTCLMRWRQKSEASMRRAAASPNWSGKSGRPGTRIRHHS